MVAVLVHRQELAALRAEPDDVSVADLAAINICWEHILTTDM